MAYYLSKKNEKFLAPFLAMLEKSNKTLRFNVSNSKHFHHLLRSAFNTTHPQLKEKYSITSNDSQVICRRIDIQISLEFDYIIEHTVDLTEIGQHIIDNNIPIQFTNALISEEDLSALRSLASAKNMTINYEKPKLEINYG